VRIGEYEIRWNDGCYTVGIPRPGKPGASRKPGLRHPKYYPTLEGALASLPHRVAASHFNACETMAELEAFLRGWAKATLGPAEDRCAEAAEAGAGDSTSEVAH
jgi:hypothetical protein